MQAPTVTIIEKPDLTTTINGHAINTPLPDALDTFTTLSTSVIQATRSRANGGTSTYSAYETGVNVEGGAAGSNNSSFNLTTGGMIAIIVVVVAVVMFGVASTILFVIAKRRQWKVRDSIRRISRRVTGRGVGPSKSDIEKRKRSGAVMSSRGPEASLVKPHGHKRAVAVEVGNVEPGTLSNVPNEPVVEKRWTQRLWSNDWK